MDKIYKHEEIEKKWYDFWEKNNLFTPKTGKNKKPYCIIMPPPNANGDLHIGHARFLTLEDILIRYHRMLGDAALWLPGTDHAGILTQVVYERELAKEGKTRFDLGREKFFKSTYKFSQENKKKMENQIRRLGASCDWSREKFTLDPEISKIVLQTFCDLYEDGLIYRGERIINWCIRCGTALSDLEVEHEEKAGHLWFLKYPLEKGGQISVATTRPETMLGDTAVAVNPKDSRYQNLIGQNVILPLIQRTIPIITDSKVDPEFGTGAVKITPAHDPTDFEIGQTHNLTTVQVIGFDGKMTKYAGEYAGLTISAAREKILEDLKAKNLLVKVEDYKPAILKCERCLSTIEPMVSKQWFISVNKNGDKTSKNLVRDAKDAVKTGKINIFPRRYEKVYFNWMENLHDWCISRQLWWGHRIPVWYCGKEKGLAKPLGFYEGIIPQLFSGKTKTYRLKDHWYKTGDKVAFHKTSTFEIFGFGEIKNVIETTVGKLPLNDPAHGAVYKKREELIEALERHNKFKVNEKTKAFIYEYKFTPLKKTIKGCGEIIVSPQKPKFCPRCQNQILEQDPDTLDTWFSSGQWPYTTLTTSKEKDFEFFYPTSVMETGYDILFFWVARMMMLGIYKTSQVPFRTVFLHGLVRDEHGQKMSKSKGNVIDPLIEADRLGADAVRLSLIFGSLVENDLNLGEDKIRSMRNFTNKLWNIGRFVIDTKPEKFDKNPKLKDDDKKILVELEETANKVTKALINFRFSESLDALYDFVWHKFADIYIEKSKNRREESQATLEKVFSTSLLLLHPFMPFITEELWHRLGNKDSIMIQNWPA